MYIKKFNFQNFFKIEYLYIFFLIIIFFVYGLSLSEFIDFVFPDHDESIPEYRIILEIVGEIGVTYLIYFTLEKYINNVINQLFDNNFKNKPPYFDKILLIAFSIGIYKHIEKSTIKINYFKTKYIESHPTYRSFFSRES